MCLDCDGESTQNALLMPAMRQNHTSTLSIFIDCWVKGYYPRTSRLQRVQRAPSKVTWRPDCLKGLWLTFRPLLLGRLLWLNLIKPVSNVRLSTRPYVRPSTKTFFDFNEIWYIGRGRRVMHDGMQYDPIQGQGQDHEPLKVGNSTIFKRYLLPHL